MRYKLIGLRNDHFGASGVNICMVEVADEVVIMAPIRYCDEELTYDP